MRRVITTAVCGLTLIVMAQPVSAQTIGFKLGMTSSKFDMSDFNADDLDRLNSLGVGGFIRVGSAGLALQAEALGVTKGTKIGGADADNGKFKLEYIEIPLTAVFSLRSGPYVFSGGSVAFETSCEFAPAAGGPSRNCDDDDPDADTFLRKETDFGVLVGAGF